MAVVLTGLAASVTFDENDINVAPRVIDSDVTLLALPPTLPSSLSVSGLRAGEDRVSILNQGSGAGQIGFDGSVVRYEGVQIGTANGGVGATLNVTFTGIVGGAAIDALIQALTYANVSDMPTASRSLRLQVIDALGADVDSSVIVNVTAQNDAPQITSANVGGITENQNNVAYLATASDPDGTANLSWSIAGLDGGLFSIDADGVVRFLASPDFEAPADIDRNNAYDVRVTVSDGVASASLDVTIGVGNWPEGPRLLGFGPEVTFREEDFAPGIPLRLDTDVDVQEDGTIAGGLLEIIDYSFRPEDVFYFSDYVDPLGRLLAVTDDDVAPRVSYAGVDFGSVSRLGNVLTIQFNENATEDAVEALIESISYLNLSQDPAPTRTIGLLLRDQFGAVTPPPFKLMVVGVTPLDSAPVITSGATATQVEGGTPIVHLAMATDVDDPVLTWSLEGPDAAFLSIDQTGAVRFVTAPDFEAPTDAGEDNVYDVVVVATGTEASSRKAVQISVTDRNEILRELRIADVSERLIVDEDTANATPTILDANVTFSAANDLNGATLIVSGLLPEDRLVILPVGDAAGQIGVAEGIVRFGGVAIGTVSGGVGADLVVTFGATATAPAVEALIQRLAYANVSDTPVAERTLRIDMAYADGWALQGVFPPRYGAPEDFPFDGLEQWGATSPTFADLDADGDPDLVLGSGDGLLRSWRNEDGAFVPLSGAANPFAGINIGARSTPTFVDLDGDGVDEIVVGGLNSGLRVWSLVAGSYAETPDALTILPGHSLGAAIAPSFVDLDGDGRRDLVVGSGNAQLFAWRNTGSAFEPLLGSDSPFAGLVFPSFDMPTFADLTNDGRLDLVVGSVAHITGFSIGRFGVWQNTAAGFVPLEGADNPLDGLLVPLGAPAFADVDADGDLDFVYGSEGGSLTLQRNVTAPATIRVSVTPTNDAPIFDSASAITVSESALGVIYRATATDPEGNPFAFSLAGADAPRFALHEDGTLRFRSAPDFEHPTDQDGDNVYQLTLLVSDGAGVREKTLTVTVSDLRDDGVLTGFGPGAGFIEDDVNAVPRRLDADVAFSATGSLADVVLTLSGLLPEDTVGIADIGDGPGQIGFGAGTVRYAGVAIGSASGGQGAPLSVTFNGAATPVAVEALIEALTYANASQTPTPLRRFTLSLTDEDGSILAPDAMPVFTPAVGTESPFRFLASGASGGFAQGTPAIGDLDNDGDLDFAYGRGAADVVLYEYDSFLGISRFDGFLATAGAGGAAPVIVDIDSDGWRDVVVGRSDGRFQFFRNDHGTLVEQTGAANPFDGLAVSAEAKPAFVDLDRDGRLDLVAGSLDQGVFAWRNTGNGYQALTGEANPFAGITGLFWTAPTFTDLDGDGLADLVLGSLDGTLRTWRDDGANFLALVGSANPFDGFDVGDRSVPAFGDLDGDGRQDLVVGRGDGEFSTWWNLPPASLRVSVAASNDPQIYLSPRSITVAENATGIIYLISIIDPDGSPSWSQLPGLDLDRFRVLGDGNVSFRTPPDFEAPGDSNGDNIYQFAITVTGLVEPIVVTVTVTDVREPGTLDGIAPFVTLPQGAAPRLLFPAADFAPGFATPGGTLVVSGLTVGDVATILSDGNGAGQIGVDGATVRYGGVAIGTASGGMGGDLVVALDDATTGEAIEALIRRIGFIAGDAPTPLRTITLELTDPFGANGLLPASARLVVLPAAANPFAGVTGSGSQRTPAFVDLDEDGLSDLVLGGFGGPPVAWRNTGFGFTPLTGGEDPFAGVDGGTWIAPVFEDLDGDGRPDMVSGGIVELSLEEEAIGGALRVWRNTGSGFEAQPAHPLASVDPGSYARLVFHDLDGDGDRDLLAGNEGGALSAWRLTGSSYEALTGAENPFAGISVDGFSAPAFQDVDGDGVLDLVVGDAFGVLRAWRNVGGDYVAMTGPADPFAGSGQPGLGLGNAPGFLDLDGDGRFDLILGTDSSAAQALVASSSHEVVVFVGPQNKAPIGGVAIGPDGETIRASHTIADADGLGAIAYAWQASADGGATWQDVAGAAGPLFSGFALVGSSLLRALARYVDGRGTAEEVASAAARIGAAGADQFTTAPGIVLLYGASGNDRLFGGAGNDVLLGGTETDTLSGLGGADWLDGGSGADSMAGGAGDDTYVVDEAADRVVETRTGGADKVHASLSWTLGAHQEGLVLIGDAAIDGTGNNLNNVITGNDAANTLTGAGRADTLIGGGGNDLYLPDATDTLIEQENGGYDTVILNATFALSDHIEELRFNGTANARGDGNAADNLIVGNIGNNRLLGYDGNDTLNGGQGNDTLQGGEGADSLVGGEGVDRLDGGNGDDTYVQLDADQVIELANAGIDTVLSNIGYTLPNAVENLTLLGSGDLSGTGNALDNVLIGNGGANALRGLGGHDRLSGGQAGDTLEGGLGADTLTGSGGFDHFLWLSPLEGGDTVVDFRPAEDKLALAAGGFGGLAVVTLSQDAAAGGAAQFVYTRATGTLAWDADGSGTGAAAIIATLSNKPTLAATDFVIV